MNYLSQMREGDLVFKKIFQSLPFVYHRPPLNMPIRNAITLSTQRPVQLLEIGKMISKKISVDGDSGLIDIQKGIEYLRRERIGSRDAGNLFTAALRSIYLWNAEKAIVFGTENVKTLPDKRAIMSLVTYLNRAGRQTEALALLNNVRKNDPLLKKTKLFMRAFYKHKTSETPFLFEIENPIKLSKGIIHFQCPIEDSILPDSSPDKLQLELSGSIMVQMDESPSASIAVFEFLDERDQPIEFARINGLTFSKNVGWYSYLRQNNETGKFNVFLEVDSRIKSVRLGFKNWHAKSTIMLQPDVELKPSTINEIWLEFDQFIANIGYANCKEIVFLFSGTTYIQDIRANRPIRLAKYFIENNIPVIFSYHRWNRNESIPEYSGDLLFQTPIDITLQMMDRISKIENIEHKMFMISYPHQAIPKLLNRFRIKSWKCIYDARDDWEEFEKVGQAKWYKSSNEKYIVRNADYVTAVSQVLADKLQLYEPIHPVTVNRNALSDNFLSPSYKKRKSEENIAGYFGHLTGSWFDWERLIEIAKLRPAIKFEIIGHSEPQELELPANIELLGPKNHTEINDIASYWKVGIIPFKVGKLSDAVDPIKIYEYFALGLPVVSFRMPQIMEYPYTLTVESTQEFADALDEYIKKPPMRQILNKWLLENKWEHRAEEYRSLLLERSKDEILGLEVYK